MVGTLSFEKALTDGAQGIRQEQSPPFGGPPADGDNRRSDRQEEPVEPLVRNGHIGMAVFLGAEAMFFAGLIGVFLVFRFGSQVWPPPFQPRLPLGITLGNTAVLLLSALTMLLSHNAWKRKARSKFIRYLLVTSALGIVFMAVQGSEWIRLIHFGLTISSGVYGGTFYTLIGFHGLHVLGAVLWLVCIFFHLRKAPLEPRFKIRLELCAIYWYFVVGLWPVLFGLVYWI